MRIIVTYFSLYVYPTTDDNLALEVDNTGCEEELWISKEGDIKSKLYMFQVI